MIKKSFWDDKRALGVPNGIDLGAYTSIHAMLDEAMSQYGEKPAFTGMGRTLSYSQLDTLSSDFAAYLQHCTSLKPGDRLAIQLPNLLQFPIIAFAAIRAGLVIVNMNPLYTAREMLYQLQDSGSKGLVFLDFFGDKVEEIISQTQLEMLVVTSVGDMQNSFKRLGLNFFVRYIKKRVPNFHLPGAIAYRQVLQQGSTLPRAEPKSTTKDSVAVLQYTGGTTGVSKGAMLTHKNIMSNMLQVNAILQQQNKEGEVIFKAGEETLVAPLPFYHIYAFTVHLMCMTSMGCHNLLIVNPRDISNLIHSLKKNQFTGIVGLNTLFAALLKHRKFKKLSFKNLKLTISGGMALAPKIGNAWFELTGCKITEGYGLTECSPVVSFNPLGDLGKFGTVGLPVPGTLVKVLDIQGQEAEIGEVGELCVKGPQVMQGYWQNQGDKMAPCSLQGNAWFYTGDLAVIDEDGFIKIADRIKDIILVSGFNVYPNEIEEQVLSHPFIDACAAVGMADEKTGEAIKLVVVLAKNAQLDEGQIIAWCRQNLTPYKVPKIVQICQSLPTNAVGKVLRRCLR